jgi:hypothetical protein
MFLQILIKSQIQNFIQILLLTSSFGRDMRTVRQTWSNARDIHDNFLCELVGGKVAKYSIVEAKCSKISPECINYVAHQSAVWHGLIN